jgi:hypothetical protein
MGAYVFTTWYAQLGEAVSFDFGPNVRFVLLALIGLLNGAGLLKNTRATNQAAKQLVPNGGGSMFDSVKRIENSIDSLAARVSSLERHSFPPPTPPG